MLIEILFYVCYNFLGENMKAIIFDFDGTLTYKNSNIWRSIWEGLGYDVSAGSLYSNLYSKFIRKEINYQQWCDLTCQAFKKFNLNKKFIDNISTKIRLLPGIKNLLEFLKKKGVSLHLVSGGIKSVIEDVLGENTKYFDSINANVFVFNNENYLDYIRGTEFDYEHKATFIEKLKERNCLKGEDICFIGNGDNDEWAYLSGCKTICVNPDNVDVNNKLKWNIVFRNLNDLEDLIPVFKKIFITSLTDEENSF